MPNPARRALFRKGASIQTSSYWIGRAVAKTVIPTVGVVILTEAGDTITTEAGDNLLTES